MVSSGPMNITGLSNSAGGIDVAVYSGNMQITGPVTATTTVAFYAQGSFFQDAAIVGPTGVSVSADTILPFGPLATTNGAPIAYDANGTSVAPPPTELSSGSSGEGVQADVLVTFLETSTDHPSAPSLTSEQAADLRGKLAAWEADWNAHPVGNGPFRFVTHEPNRRWVFAANPDFPVALGGPPPLERFIVVVVDEPMIKLSALVAGELDFAGVSPQHAAFVRRHPTLGLIEYPLILPYGLVFNTRRAPFDDARVRLAAALAIDRQEIVDGYLFGFAAVADGPVPPGLPRYLPVPPPGVPLAPDSARRLLAGRRPRFEILTVGSGEAALEQMLQARLAAVGFDVAIRQLELSAFLDRVYGPRHDFTAAVMGVPGDPGLGYLQPLGDLTGIPVPADPLAAQRLFAERLPVVWLYHARGVQGMNRRVRNVRMDMRGELPTVAAWQVQP